MLKNKIIVKKIRNIFILLMAILIMVGIYHNIRNSRAENVIEIEMEVSDKSNILSAQTIMVEATETSEGNYLLDLPTSVNGNIVTKYYTADGEEILTEEESNTETIQLTKEERNTVTIQLTEEEVANKKIQLQTDYDTKEVTANDETRLFYNKELQNTPNEDGTENKDVIVTGYMPLNAQLEVTEIDLSTLTAVQIPNESQTMQKAYEISVYEMVEKQATETDTANVDVTNAEEIQTEGEAQSTSTETTTENTTYTDKTTETNGIIATAENVEMERVEYDPSVYGEKLTIKTNFTQTDVIATIYNLEEDNQVTEIASTANEENINFEIDKNDKTIKYIIATEPKPEEETIATDETSSTEENAESILNDGTTTMAPNEIKNSEWEVVDSKTELLKGRMTVVVKGPEDELTEDWVNLIVNGERLENGITKTITEKEKLSDGVQYTITITGIPTDAYQIKIELAPQVLSGIQMFSMEDDTTSDDSGIMLLATTYNTLKSDIYVFGRIV